MMLKKPLQLWKPRHLLLIMKRAKYIITEDMQYITGWYQPYPYFRVTKNEESLFGPIYYQETNHEKRNS